MDAIKGFFQRHGAVPVDERRGTGWASMATADLRRWLADYERMTSTKRTPNGQPLDDEQIDRIRQQIREMRQALEGRPD